MKLETRGLFLLLTSQQLLLQVNIFPHYVLGCGLVFPPLCFLTVLFLFQLLGMTYCCLFHSCQRLLFLTSPLSFILDQGVSNLRSGLCTMTFNWILAFLYLIFLIIFVCLKSIKFILPCALNKIQLPWMFFWLYYLLSLSVVTSPSSRLLLEVSVSFHQIFFSETLQVFVASHLQVSFFTFYEKCWCLDLRLCLDFYIVTDLFFQNHHLSQQTWLRTTQFVYFFCSTSLLNCSSSILIVVSSVPVG